MLIVCPSCASEYMIEPAQIGADGRMVRCAACRDTFFVAGEPEPTEEELAETEEFHAFLEQQPTAWPAADEPLAVEAESARSEPEVGPAAARLRLRLPSIPLAALARLAAVPKAPVLALILVGLVGGAVLGRERIVAAAPATARLYAAAHLSVNPLGLDLKGVRSELVLNGQDQLLVVEGEILNRRGRDVEVPSLRLTVRGPDGLELYTWTNEPPRKTLAAAETARFRARLASPPAEGREVLVRFAHAAPGATVAATAP
ncbi:MAG: MJ0042-type zinc finger domain-containing protein [Microvirga sp.]